MISTEFAGEDGEVRMVLEQLRRRFVALRLDDDIAGDRVPDIGDALG